MQPAKYQAIALGMFLMVGAFTGCLGDDDDDTTTDTTVTKTAVKIGFLNPLTGPLEPDAPGFTWAANEAIADLNAASTTHTYELVEVDSACDGTPAAAGAQTLIDSGVVAVAGAACSGASMGANAVLSAAGIPMISYASTNPGLSDATAYPLFYRIVPSDAIQGPAGADMMADGGVTNGSLAILHMTNDYGSGLADSIKAAWEDDGHALCGAGMQGYEDTATDFSALAQSVVDNTDCTAVYLSSYITDAAGIIEALNDKGYTGQIYGGDGPAGIGLYEKLTDNSMAENMTVSAPRAGSTYGTFEARYDADNATIGSIKTYVLTTYDAVTIIGQAAAMSGAINDNIKTTGTGFEGSSGLLTFLDNGDVGGAGYDICTYGGADESYTCGKYWTAIGGVQDSS
ncbi:MAG: ABC transporter substrate-binding protein [Candidatus Poseidoniia archaeon]|nr:ABC transporter substrate-binding protein [Candidatus Poseidoniia archaeon]|tara:strand:- start:3931 stop:5130 length:1200 start_codon:yes stop_codon:yes gene_type:complete